MSARSHNFSSVQLFCRDVPTSADDHELGRAFFEFGIVTESFVTRRGCGFVTFERPGSARDALAEADGIGIYVGGSRIRVEKARELRVSSSKHDAPRKRPLDKAQSGPMRLFCRGLPESADDDDLFAAFRSFGLVTNAYVVRGQGGASKGFGFVVFDKRRDAEAALLTGAMEATGILVDRSVPLATHSRITVEVARERTSAESAESGGLQRPSIYEEHEPRKRQRARDPPAQEQPNLEEEMRARLLSQLPPYPEAIPLGPAGHVLYGKLTPKVPRFRHPLSLEQQEDVKEHVKAAGGARAFLSRFEEFKVFEEEGNGWWIRRAIGPSNDLRNRISSSSSFVRQSAPSDAAAMTDVQTPKSLEEHMHARLLSYMPPAPEAVPLGQAVSVLYGKVAASPELGPLPPDMQDKAKDQVQAEGGAWTFLKRYKDFEVFDTEGHRTWIRRVSSPSPRTHSTRTSGSIPAAPAVPAAPPVPPSHATAGSVSMPPSRVNAIGKRSFASLSEAAEAPSGYVRVEILLARPMDRDQARCLAVQSACTLRDLSSKPPLIVLEGTPDELAFAARLLLKLHVAKDGVPCLTLLADEDQVNSIISIKKDGAVRSGYCKHYRMIANVCASLRFAFVPFSSLAACQWSARASGAHKVPGCRRDITSSPLQAQGAAPNFDIEGV